MTATKARKRKTNPPVPLPSSLKDAVALADWLEISALAESDKNASKAGLEAVLLRASAVNSSEAAESLALEVFNEVERRANRCGDAYPFEVHLPVLAQRDNLSTQHLAYQFCLVLSYFGWKAVKGATINPWLLFEHISAHAAAQCSCSNVIVFGTSAREGTSASFRTRIDELAAAMGEGGGFRSQSTMNAQDDHVDLIAIRRLDIDRKANLIVFGQCAAGDNWKGKDSELDGEAFWDQWFRDSKVSHLLNSFFIPHCVTDEKFDHTGRRSGVLFDRIRVSRWAATHPLNVELIAKMSRWVSDSIRQI